MFLLVNVLFANFRGGALFVRGAVPLGKGAVPLGKGAVPLGKGAVPQDEWKSFDWRLHLEKCGEILFFSKNSLFS